MSNFCADIILQKKISKEKLRKKLSYKKGAHKMLLKLTPVRIRIEEAIHLLLHHSDEEEEGMAGATDLLQTRREFL